MFNHLARFVKIIMSTSVVGLSLPNFNTVNVEEPEEVLLNEHRGLFVRIIENNCAVIW
jgi:hypothetical protein